MSMLKLKIQPGSSIFDQLVSAAQKAILSRELENGQTFPSVRSLAADLKIHPNTALKAVQYLIHEGWLEAKPGIGTVVAGCPMKPGEIRRHVLERDVVNLVDEARRIGMELKDLIRAIEKSWSRTKVSVEANRE
jgi:GntR family transcriptional regulator